MNCNFQLVRNWLIGAASLLGVAITFAGLAIAALVLVWTWWAAPVFIGVSAAAIFAASLMVNQARTSAFQYYACVINDEPSPRSPCWGAWANFRNSAIALSTTLGILAATAGMLAGSFMGWWSAPDTSVLLGGIITNAILIPTLLVFLRSLVNCLENQG